MLPTSIFFRWFGGRGRGWVDNTKKCGDVCLVLGLFARWMAGHRRLTSPQLPDAVKGWDRIDHSGKGDKYQPRILISFKHGFILSLIPDERNLCIICPRINVINRRWTRGFWSVDELVIANIDTNVVCIFLTSVIKSNEVPWHRGVYYFA